MTPFTRPRRRGAAANGAFELSGEGRFAVTERGRRTLPADHVARLESAASRLKPATSMTSGWEVSPNGGRYELGAAPDGAAA